MIQAQMQDDSDFASFSNHIENCLVHDKKFDDDHMLATVNILEYNSLLDVDKGRTCFEELPPSDVMTFTQVSKY